MTHYFVSDGLSDFDVLVDDEADLDGTFEAIDIDSGNVIRINGWQAITIERVENAL